MEQFQIDFLKEKITKNPSDYFNYFQLGIIFQNTKQYDLAEQQYNLSIKHKNDFAQSYYQLGKLQQDLKQYDKAEKQYQIAIKYKEDYAQVYFGLGKLYHSIKQYDKAEQYYNLAIKYKDDYLEVYTKKGKLYYDLNQYDKAEQQYNLALKYKENYSEAYNNLGNIYFNQKQYGKSEQFYQLSLKYTQKSKHAKSTHKNLGILYENYFLNLKKAKYSYKQILNIEKYKKFANDSLKLINEKIKKEKNQLQNFYLSEEEFEKNYQQLEKIGQGQYGNVFKIKNIQKNKFYAMKVIPIEQNKDKILMEVNNILQIQIKFKSKSIVRVKFVVETKPKLGSSQIFIGMELAQNNLKNIQKPLSQKQAINLIKNTLKGLEEMYYQNIIHRDIKPDNILYFEDLQSFKLTDFGTSRFTQNTQNQNQNQNELPLFTLIGTPAYFGPELYDVYKKNGQRIQQMSIQDTQSIDWFANDLYGLGMSFLFAICQVESVTQFRNRYDLITQELHKMEAQNKYDPLIYYIIKQMTQQDQKERVNILFDLIEISKQL